MYIVNSLSLKNCHNQITKSVSWTLICNFDGMGELVPLSIKMYGILIHWRCCCFFLKSLNWNSLSSKSRWPSLLELKTKQKKPCFTLGFSGRFVDGEIARVIWIWEKIEKECTTLSPFPTLVQCLVINSKGCPLRFPTLHTAIKSLCLERIYNSPTDKTRIQKELHSRKCRVFKGCTEHSCSIMSFITIYL